MTDRKKFEINSEVSSPQETGRRFTVDSPPRPAGDPDRFRIVEPEGPGEPPTEPRLESVRAFGDRLMSRWRSYVSEAVTAFASARDAKNADAARATRAAEEARQVALRRRTDTANQIAREQEQLAGLGERVSRLHSNVFARDEPNAVWRLTSVTALEQVVAVVEATEAAARRLGSGPTWRVRVSWWRQPALWAGICAASFVALAYVAVGARGAGAAATSAAIVGTIWWAYAEVAKRRQRRVAERALVRQCQEAMSTIRAFGRRLDERESENASSHLNATATIDTELQQALARTEAAFQRQQLDTAATFRAALVGLANQARSVLPTYGVSVAPWNDSGWRDAASAKKDGSWLRLGEATVTTPDSLNAPPVEMSVPIVTSFLPERGVYVRVREEERDRAIALAQAMLARVFATSRPGSIRLLAIDPRGLGGNLGRFLQLIGSSAQFGRGVVANERDVEQALRDLLQHMSEIVQKRLKGVFKSLNDYNIASKIKESYVVLPVFDYPGGLSVSTQQLLATVCAQGPAAGVFPIILDTGGPGQRADNVPAALVSLQGGGDVWTLGSAGDAVPFDPDGMPDTSLVDLICERFVAGADDGNTPIAFSDIATAEATASSAAHLRIPIGLAVDGSIKQLALGEGTAHSVLIGGRPGSGKSNLLNVIIVSAVSKYSPSELELYLIDFKKGVEFKAFAVARLPHARVIAVESEREFGLSVLRSLDAELSRRGEAFRAVGASDLAGFRARGAECPRILLIIDEFQEFFVSDDGHAADARELLGRLILQGRGFGIHVLLASQAIGGPRTLPKAVLDQVVVRIALQASEDVSRQILSDDNPAAAQLRPGGYALYNASGGFRSANEPMRVAFLASDEKARRLAALPRRLGDRTPTIFEGRQPADLLTSAFFDGESSRKQSGVALLGEPSLLGAFVTANVGRPSRGHMAIVAKQPSIGLGMMTASVLSAMATTRPGSARFWLCDASAGYWSDAMSVFAEQHVHEVLAIPPDRLCEMVDGFEVTSKDHLTYLFLAGASPTGTHAEDLRSLPASIERAVKLGLRLVVACDSVAGIPIAINRPVLDQIGFKAAGVMSTDHSSTFLRSTAAAKLDGRYQAVFLDVDEGDQLTVFRPYALPTPEALRECLRRLSPTEV